MIKWNNLTEMLQNAINETKENKMDLNDKT